ncbi:MBL fold metallo-hydrolase [Aureitalea marina]|uniref:MBL fold metallo-hydrolase n=1 Tax=Aureitalea marina TaxID=930804 RepID=A0A2S7KNA1_9FLAO|nr:MBL fold metallo-hydrolase [Aureitalea marina]PQB04105.1 MBL fold metallo-hydrolase [Aureitalea marina]
MVLEQIYTGCLAQGAYYIQSEGEAAIIDPLRETRPYTDRAKRDGAVIKYIFETHFHADFVSGHVTLAQESGASIVYGPLANPSYDAIIAEDGQEFKIGKVTIRVLHTPGHTMESTTYLLLDEQGEPHCIFSGDTLFLGDVGRPDLAQKAASMTQEELAGTLFDSLRNKIMPLPDHITVYPAHGAGSACGKNMSSDTQDTLGNQKRTNYALRVDMTREEFIQEVTDGLLPPPKYFPENVRLNKEGYKSLDQVMERGHRPLDPDTFEQIANQEGALVLDVRHQADFVKSHIPRSIFIGIDGGFAPWVGALIADVNQPLLIVAPEGREEETITRLSRVGFDHSLGYLEGGINSWEAAGKEVDDLLTISADEFKDRLESKEIPVLDVRKESEYEAGHLKDAILAPLAELNDHLAEIPQDETFYIHCAGGYRSVIAASILKGRGRHNLVDVGGGFKAIKAAEIPIVSE